MLPLASASKYQKIFIVFSIPKI
ncbi:hypothetical protein BpHYR1_048717 [Brachionus plicatilis]|uniref:Uncharacterized protein n=1 Tax=Brachionus plicatilis TaxID=10195 RepID=A0A3M7PGN1_BRAPC|nr:hypothetical protein BpHYR1_048717 [Brachionus plicatilis]